VSHRRWRNGKPDDKIVAAAEPIVARVALRKPPRRFGGLPSDAEPGQRELAMESEALGARLFVSGTPRSHRRFSISVS
jgi:hypothetical protein